jgi:hypothetical protein
MVEEVHCHRRWLWWAPAMQRRTRRHRGAFSVELLAWKRGKVRGGERKKGTGAAAPQSKQ